MLFIAQLSRITTYPVIPMTPKFGMIGFIRNAISYDKLIKMNRKDDSSVAKESEIMEQNGNDFQNIMGPFYLQLFHSNHLASYFVSIFSKNYSHYLL